MVGTVDNLLGTNIRGSVSFSSSHDQAEFEKGLSKADKVALAAGTGLMVAGAGEAATGAMIAVGSLAAEPTPFGEAAGATIAAGGLAKAGAGMWLAGNASRNLMSRKFDGGADTENKTSSEAFRNAKDQNGIPRSQQPDNTTMVRDKDTGKPLKQYEFTNSKGVKITIRKDNPKTYPDGGKQGPHYNAGKSSENKLKQHHYYEK